MRILFCLCLLVCGCKSRQQVIEHRTDCCCEKEPKPMPPPVKQ